MLANLVQQHRRRAAGVKAVCDQVSGALLAVVERSAVGLTLGADACRQVVPRRNDLQDAT